MAKKVFAAFVALLIITGSLVGAVFVMTTNNDSNSEPDVLYEFQEICKIPRYSGYEEKMEQYLIDLADKLDYPHEKDSVGNVRIDHVGSIDTGLILQAHMDMVCATNPEIIHNWKTDPLETVIEDGYIRAKGTSLGADDGAGLAIIVSALKSNGLKDYSFRCIFTVDEEESMTGILNLNPEWTVGYKKVICLDGNNDCEICIGSAGMYVSEIDMDLPTEQNRGDRYYLHLTGFNGGHSGLDIDKNVNVIALAFEFLKELRDNNIEVMLIEFKSGTAYNAIPNDAMIRFSVSDSDDTERIFKEWKNKVTNEYQAKNPKMSILLTHFRGEEINTMTKEVSSKLISVINECPHGVIKWGSEGVLESLNYGILDISNNKIKLIMSSRCADDEEHKILNEKVSELFEKNGFEIESEKTSISWLESKDCTFVKKSAEIYENLVSNAPNIIVVHAGTECGYFKEKNSELQVICIGPNIIGEHSTSERLEIDSLIKVKDYTFELIKGCASF